jgi:hypothetical protein
MINLYQRRKLYNMFSGRRVGSKPVKMKLTLGGGHESTQQAPTAESSTTGLSEKSTDESVHTTATSTVTAETQQTDEGSKKLTFSLSMSTNRTVKTTRKNLFSSPAKRAADSDEEDDTAAEQVILLTGFEDNKAQSANPEPERGPLVIPALPNRDWRSARRALQTATKDMLAANQGPTTGAVERITHDQEQYGLQLPRKRSKLETDADTSTVTVRTEEASTSPEPTEAAATAAAASPTSLDEQAVKALLEEAKQHIDGPAETSSESERSKLVLPMGGDASNMTHLTSADRARIEHEAFKADLEACPDEVS